MYLFVGKKAIKYDGLPWGTLDKSGGVQLNRDVSAVFTCEYVPGGGCWGGDEEQSLFAFTDVSGIFLKEINIMLIPRPP